MKNLLLAALPGFAGAATAQPAVAPEGTAMTARMRAIPMAKLVESPDAYTPTETVAGERGRAIPVGTGGVSADALAGAQSYADAQNSFALLVAKDGKLVHAQYAPAFTPASRFATASMHKAVLALACKTAIARGKIALADPLAKHLPEFAGKPLWRGHDRTVAADDQRGGVAACDAGQPAIAGDAADVRRRQSRGGNPCRGDDPARHRVADQNVSSQLAGLALMAALGKRYAGFLSRTLWAPMEAGEAQLWLDLYRADGNPHYFCCLQATATDWLRVGELVRGGKVQGKQVVAADWVRTVTAPSPLNANFGMNFWRGSPHAPLRSYGKGVPLKVPAARPLARDDLVFIDGADGQRVYVVPSTGVTIVR